MTHEDEHNIQEEVRGILEGEFGEDNVEEEKYLPETGRFVDFYVETALIDMAIEVENDFESVVTGVGQTLLYAQHELGAVPMVVIPEGHDEQPETDLLRREVAIIEV